MAEKPQPRPRKRKAIVVTAAELEATVAAVRRKKKAPPKRRCQGKTKAGGRCKAAPLKDGKHCSAHDPNRPDETRFGSRVQAARAGAAEKPRVLKLTEVLNRELEAQAEGIVGALVESLAATRGVTIRIGDGMDELVSTPDFATRIKAARELLDRGLGRPKVVAEVSGPEGGPIQTSAELDLSGLTSAELEQLEGILAKAAPGAADAG